MNIIRILLCGAIVCGTTLVMGQEVPAKRSPAATQPDPAVAAIRAASEQSVVAFNAGKVDESAAMFLSKGEFVDENGTVYQGEQEIKDLFRAFFKKYPDTKLSLDIESIRIAGPVAFEEGTRTLTGKDGTKSKFRYVTVRAHTMNGWKIASLRDFEDEPVLAHGEYLQPLAWMVGDWINEGTDGSVAMSFKWSDDKNYLLGEFRHMAAGGTMKKSTQRIGWDSSVRKIRSWLFEADGGFADGYWTVLDDGVVAKYSSVNPDGRTASATITMVQKGKDRFSISGTDRIVGDNREPDFEITVTRRPPTAAK